MEVHFPTVVAEGWVGFIHDRNNQVSQQNLHNIEGVLLEKAETLFSLKSGEKPLALLSSRVEVINHKDELIFHLRFEALDPQLPFIVQSDFLQEENPEFRSTLTVVNAKGEQLALDIHSSNKLTSEVMVKRKSKSWQTFVKFLQEGIHHIFIGFDHLLFLFALLVVCRSLRPAILVISCFTLAHSVTLALAALNILNIPSSVVELFIALSIVYVGVENLLTKHQPKMRWILTAIFGLVHGLGFANVLREVGLGAEGAPIVLPLLAFNLGVEVGQITLAVIFLPLLWYLRKLPQFEARVLPALSIFVVVMGAYWAISRF